MGRYVYVFISVLIILWGVCHQGIVLVILLNENILLLLVELSLYPWSCPCGLGRYPCSCGCRCSCGAVSVAWGAVLAAVESCPWSLGAVLVAWGGILVAVDVAVAVELFLWRGKLSLQPWRAVPTTVESCSYSRGELSLQPWRAVPSAVELSLYPWSCPCGLGRYPCSRGELSL